MLWVSVHVSWVGFFFGGGEGGCSGFFFGGGVWGYFLVVCFMSLSIFISGQQTAFIRSCSALDPSVAREGCFNDTSTPSLQTKCYILCFQDGCNGSYVISGHVFLVAFVSVLSYFVYDGRNIL